MRAAARASGLANEQVRLVCDRGRRECAQLCRSADNRVASEADVEATDSLGCCTGTADVRRSFRSVHNRLLPTSVALRRGRPRQRTTFKSFEKAGVTVAKNGVRHFRANLS
jgi:hypothetical protein